MAILLLEVSETNKKIKNPAGLDLNNNKKSLV